MAGTDPAEPCVLLPALPSWLHRAGVTGRSRRTPYRTEVQQVAQFLVGSYSGHPLLLGIHLPPLLDHLLGDRESGTGSTSPRAGTDPGSGKPAPGRRAAVPAPRGGAGNPRRTPLYRRTDGTKLTNSAQVCSGSLFPPIPLPPTPSRAHTHTPRRGRRRQELGPPRQAKANKQPRPGEGRRISERLSDSLSRQQWG